ncbi:MAG TPA: hypothetical protein VGC87_08925 [Pyrinomonadaceae bacterium]|jgi:hypothetical protein
MEPSEAAEAISELGEGEGKKELSERAQSFEADRDRALKQDASFDNGPA